MLPLQMSDKVPGDGGWRRKIRPPALQQMICQAADVTSHQPMLDGKPHTHAVEPNDRLGAVSSGDVQLKVEQEGRGGETGATKHE
jgi:hypothetical protein